MQEYIIALDTGTTNTRASLWEGKGRFVAVQRRAVGVRDTVADGDNRRLKAAVRACMRELLLQQGLTWADIDCVVASGMITSNAGLVEIPHLTAPVSKADLARGMRPVMLADVCPLPIYFIPGVKNAGAPVTTENFEAMDIMRGEETETIALWEVLRERGPWLIVLPGSHTKFVSVDAQGRITGCLTSITGELVAAVTGHTIIADAVRGELLRPENYDRERLLLGFDAAERTGLGRACFSARILSQLGGEPPEKLANYVLGACLQSDVAAIRGSKALCVQDGTGVLVAGSGPLCRAVTDVLLHAGGFSRVRAYDPGEGVPLSASGALSILKGADGNQKTYLSVKEDENP